MKEQRLLIKNFLGKNTIESLLAVAAHQGKIASFIGCPEKEKVISSESFRNLLIRIKDSTDPMGMRVEGAIFDGELNLDNFELNFALAFHACEFPFTVSMQNLNCFELRFDESKFNQTLEARSVFIKGSLFATKATFNRGVCLANSTVGGIIDISEANLTCLAISNTQFTTKDDTNPNQRSFDGSELKVRGDFVGTKLVSKGTILLKGARVGGELVLNGSTLSSEGFSLVADEVNVSQNVLLQQHTVHVSVQRLATESNPRIEDNLDTVHTRFSSRGTLCFSGARVGGQINLDGADLQNGGSGISLLMQCAVVNGDMQLRSTEDFRFESIGQIRLTSSEVKGQLCLNGAKLTAGDIKINRPRTTLNASLIVLHGNLFTSEENSKPFESHGTMRLEGARVQGRWDARSAYFGPPEGAKVSDGNSHSSLLCKGIFVERSLHFSSSTNASVGTCGLGIWSFEDCKIGGSMELLLRGGTVSLNLGHGDIQLLLIEAESVPTDSNIIKLWNFNGLKVSGVKGSFFKNTDELINFLKNISGGQFDPSRYRAIFLGLKETGRSREATRIAEEMIRRRYDAERLDMTRSQRFLSKASEALWRIVGYGYRPYRAIFLSLGVITLFSFVFWGLQVASNGKCFVPSSVIDAKQATQIHFISHPRFLPVVYTVDRFLPGISLGQKDVFRPGQPAANDFHSWHLKDWCCVLGSVCDCIVVFLGYTLSIVFAAAASGLVRRVEFDR